MKKISKREINFFTRKYITSYAIQGFIMLLIGIVLIIFSIIELPDVFDVTLISSYLIIVISFGASKLICFFITKKTEDCSKVSEDCEQLNKKYSVMKLVSYKGVKFTGVCVCDIDSSKSIKVMDNPEKFYEAPAQILDNYEAMMHAHSHSNSFNNICIRLDDITEDSDCVTIKTSRTTYFDSLVTNRASDYILNSKQLTVRERYEPGPYVKPLKQSVLSNHLGFHCFVITKDGYIPFVLRKDNLSIHKNLWGVGIQASLKTKYAIKDEANYTMNEASLGVAIINEIKDELKLKIAPELTSLEAAKGIFAFYRDLCECGKPQFVCAEKLSNITRAEITEAFLAKQDKQDVNYDGKIIEFFTREELMSADFCHGMMKINGKEYKMSSSTIVSIILFLQHKFD